MQSDRCGLDQLIAPYSIADAVRERLMLGEGGPRRKGKHAESVKPPVAAVDHEVTLRRNGSGSTVPYLLDPWSGEAVRLAQYTQDGDDFTVRIRLQPGESTIIALGRPGLFGDRHGSRPHVVATDADSALFTGEHLAVRASAPGTYTTRLNRGRPVTTTVPSLPAAVTPARWQLDVEDRRPGPTPNRTERVDVSLTLDTLLPWSNIPELADSAGIGRYRTTLDLPSD